MTAAHTEAMFGEELRAWRQRRRLSQLDLAIEADVSARHVSFMETGRSTPSRAMVLKLAEVLDVPLRERNRLLVAAGLAPMYPERGLDDPEMAAVRDGVAPSLLERPNALRLALHPEGLAPRIENLGQWREHVIGRLRREVAVSGSADLAALLAEIESYPGPEDSPDPMTVAVPLELCTESGELLRFISTVTTFGTALDLTAAELSIEAFLPADDATAEALVCRAASLGSPQ